MWKDVEDIVLTELARLKAEQAKSHYLEDDLIKRLDLLVRIMKSLPVSQGETIREGDHTVTSMTDAELLKLLNDRDNERS
jgi:hypothetical protein